MATATVDLEAIAAQLSPRQLLALRARIDFPLFCRLVYRPYVEPPHLAHLNAALAGVDRYLSTGGAEGIGRLLVMLPPRHGKSVTCARLFPAWALGRHPDARVILASHGAALSEAHSRAVRNWIRGNAFTSVFPRVKLSGDSAAREAWDLAEPNRGGLLAVGVGGAVTGRGGDLIILDDLVASREDAESELQRGKLWEWYASDLATRKEPGAALVSIGTRWHSDDVLGRLATSDGEAWHVIRLPALAEEDDPLGREPGEALWPARFPVAALKAQRAEMGEYPFLSLYQQAPVSTSGGIFRLVREVSIHKPDVPQAEHVYVFGCDWGRKVDATVISIFDRSVSPRRQVWLERFTNVPFELQEKRLIALDEALATGNVPGRESSFRLAAGRKAWPVKACLFARSRWPRNRSRS